MELQRRSSTPQDAASRAPRFGNSLRIAPRETSGTEGSNPSSSSGESGANPLLIESVAHFAQNGQKSTPFENWFATRKTDRLGCRVDQIDAGSSIIQPSLTFRGGCEHIRQ